MKIGSIAICGAQKTVIFHSEQSPRGKTYPIGASGAVISDLMDVDDTDHKSEFLCCFLAKDKRMVVFELKSKKIVVELQMTTKLNFWRFLPPIAHGDNLCFLLITPVGGFHLLPLAESPRPRQVWKRGAELQVSDFYVDKGRVFIFFHYTLTSNESYRGRKLFHMRKVEVMD